MSPSKEKWIKEIIDKVEQWRYLYTNYITQMSTKKNFEKGHMANELADEIINVLIKEK